VLGAVLERDDPRDVFISRHGCALAELPEGARVGTSSRRRMAQILHARPDVELVELRGNVDTRVSKVLDGSAGQYDGAVLAAAGILRMGYHDAICEILDLDRFTPAPGQAALGVECRSDDAATLALLETIADPDTTLTTGAERAFLREFGGGCTLPVGAHATLEEGGVRLRAMVAAEDLRSVQSISRLAGLDDVNDVAAHLAREMMAGR
jgi:hydroxymethylbilane synthase